MFISGPSLVELKLSIGSNLESSVIVRRNVEFPNGETPHGRHLRTNSMSNFFQRSSAFSYCSMVMPFSGYQRLKP